MTCLGFMPGFLGERECSSYDSLGRENSASVVRLQGIKQSRKQIRARSEGKFESEAAP